ncbi:group II intron reverse transcriptase/maturase [Aromatoleum anaerobium]|nr:group II intron reverse transcriptase/maturase [Aromatoleum anaerobium]MCK0507487.1 group II intron reverse transcriptase/maturase [Aromatoleum anaerobium]MCK0507489.1 group II intron reverse transcriptase/maturase [Aromatoleum anaerobium]
MGNLSTPISVQKLQAALHAKAKAEPEFRFYALYDKLYRLDVLTHAYDRCRANKGAPGLDGQTFGDIERYGRERWLGELALALRDETYQPEAIKRVFIPKANGKLRPLGLSNLRDRVCMMAAVLVLDPIFEEDLAPEQYAYRAGCSAHDALSAVKTGLCNGFPEVVDADLSAYFDTIPHHELMLCVARRVVDRKVLGLVKSWLECAVVEIDRQGRMTRTTNSRDGGQGIPQGAPISPLLANLYMRRFILGWQRWSASRTLDARIVNYADDLVILCRRGTADKALAAMRVLMGRLKLTVNEEKTRTCHAGRAYFDFLGYTFGRYYSHRTGGAYLGLRPSKKSIRRLIEKLRHLTDPRFGWQETTELVQNLNRTLTGWANYFSIGTTSSAYRAVEAYYVTRFRRWLLKKHKSRRNGMLAYPYEYLFETLGLVRLSGRTSNLPWAKA